MKGPATFLVIVIGLLLLWLVVSGRTGNIGAAINALLAGTNATPKPTSGSGSTNTNTGIATPATPAVPNISLGADPTSLYQPISYNSATSVSPAGFTYA